MRLLLFGVLLFLVSLVLLSWLSRHGEDKSLSRMLAQIKDLAWTHRDVEPELAQALIAQLEVFSLQTQRPDMLDTLMQIAWDGRETSPSLSTIVIDEIRGYQRRELG